MLDTKRRATDRIENRIEFESLISDLSSRFINLPPRKVDHEIMDAQRRICDLLGLDLSSLWQWSEAKAGVLYLTHLFRLVDDPPTPDPMSGTEFFPWLQARVLQGLTTFYTSSSELPPEAARDRETSLLFHVKSSLIMPLAVGGGEPFGCLTFAATQRERNWPPPVVSRLQLVGQIFASALARKQADELQRESEERLSLAVESAGAGLWHVDLSSGVFWATARAKELFGFAEDEIVTLQAIAERIHPADRSFVRDAIARARGDLQRSEVAYRVLRPDGHERWVNSRGRTRLGPSGKPDRLMGISVDVTARKEAEEALRSSQVRLDAGADLAGLAFYEVDFDRGTAFADERFRNLCGISAEDAPGLQLVREWIERIHPDDYPRVMDVREHLHAGPEDRLALEYRLVHPSAGEKWIHHLATVAGRDDTGRANRTYGVLRDITEEKRAEEALRGLSRRLLRAQEEERALLARELHDDVSQRLAVLAIDVGRAETAAAGSTKAGVMKAIREALARLSEDIHTLAYQLHPSILQELGLVEALRAECERRRRQTSIEIHLDLDREPAPIGGDAELGLFRVAQECLNNVERHAGARTVTVTLRRHNGGLLLSVRDDGVGFEPEAPRKRRSLGLGSMRERMGLVGGTFSIETAPGKGTTVLAWVPETGAAR